MKSISVDIGLLPYTGTTCLVAMNYVLSYAVFTAAAIDRDESGAGPDVRARQPSFGSARVGVP